MKKQDAGMMVEIVMAALLTFHEGILFKSLSAMTPTKAVLNEVASHTSAVQMPATFKDVMPRSFAINVGIQDCKVK